MEECTISIQWSKRNSEKFEELLKYPSGMESVDCSAFEGNDYLLRYFMFSCLCSELLLDHELYQKLLVQYERFVLEHF